jgi:eukaryotic-like serine/threonine-protein kinase
VKALGDIGAGNSLGRYDLLTPIAQGGMALVWAARLRGSRGFQKIVAVKAMLPSLSEDARFEEMFLKEAELASRIKHPNVCEILDVGEEDGTPYIVMEWINGEPLSALLKAAKTKPEPLPFSVATRIVQDAAIGLHAAHEVKSEEGTLVGLVHRDVSPQNILVGYDGIVKVVDFGIAKATESSDEKKTQAGQVKGKVQYMAPEQVGGRADRRTDIFALGIVLYLLLTGKHPFGAENDMATLRKICGPAPVQRPSTLDPKIPPLLDEAVIKALQKNPLKRFQTMAEFAEVLEKARKELGEQGDNTDVGAFVRGILGERAEKRKRTIKEALRLADERAHQVRATGSALLAPVADATNPSGVSSPSLPTPSSPSQVTASAPNGTGGTTGSQTGDGLAAPPQSHQASDAAVVADEQLIDLPKRRSPMLMVGSVAAVLTVTGILGVTAFRSKLSSADSTQTTSQPAHTTAPTATQAAPSVTAAPTPPSAAAVADEPATTTTASAAPSSTAKSSRGGIAGVPRGQATTTATAKATAAPTAVVTSAPQQQGIPKIRDPGF